MEHQDLVVYHPLGVLQDLLLGVKYTTVTSSQWCIEPQRCVRSVGRFGCSPTPSAIDYHGCHYWLVWDQHQDTLWFLLQLGPNQMPLQIQHTGSCGLIRNSASVTVLSCSHWVIHGRRTAACTRKKIMLCSIGDSENNSPCVCGNEGADARNDEEETYIGIHWLGLNGKCPL